MKKSEEKGVTLVALVVTIVILIILASIGINSGQDTISWSTYNKLRNELRIMQEKVNALNQSNQTDIGVQLTDEQKQHLEEPEISAILFNGKTAEEKETIKNQFKYFDKRVIEDKLNLSNISSDYLINVEKRIVIHYNGYEYNGTRYYMLQQIGGEAYNVEYNNKNPETGTFEVNYTKEGNKWKIEISNINYDGYNEKWEVKYKLEDDSYWKTSDELTFYVRQAGAYQIKVVHGDEIQLQMRTITVVDEDNLESENTINQVNEI